MEHAERSWTCRTNDNFHVWRYSKCTTLLVLGQAHVDPDNVAQYNCYALFKNIQRYFIFQIIYVFTSWPARVHVDTDSVAQNV